MAASLYPNPNPYIEIVISMNLSPIRWATIAFGSYVCGTPNQDAEMAFSQNLNLLHRCKDWNLHCSIRYLDEAQTTRTSSLR